MNSLRQHFERTQAEKKARAKVADPRFSANRPLGRIMTRQDEPLHDAVSEPDHRGNIELKFHNDWQQISGIQSHSKRNELKAEFLPAYQAYIDGTIAAGVGEQNDMLLKLMVWALDSQNFATATQIAQFALLNDMVMPEPFSRDVATVYAEQISEELIKNIPIERAADYADSVQKAVDITTGYDMPDQVRAKLYRALGNTLKTDKPSDAISAYEMAIKLDANVGAKTDLAQLKKTAVQA